MDRNVALLCRVLENGEIELPFIAPYTEFMNGGNTNLLMNLESGPASKPAVKRETASLKHQETVV
jgi:hypothetical protein